MLRQIRNYVLIALVIGAFYFLLSHHFVFTSIHDITMLKKDELTLKYTFFSMKQQSPERILRIDELRDAGIEDLLLERGMITEDRLYKILDEIDATIEVVAKFKVYKYEDSEEILIKTKDPKTGKDVYEVIGDTTEFGLGEEEEAEGVPEE